MGRRTALLVGNARFAPGSELEPLQGPPNDVAALGDVLADPERGDFTVRRFVDERRETVLPAIEEALNDAEASDLVVLFYAGHGRLDPSGRLCLATAETRAKALRATSIPVSELKELVAQSRAGSVVLLLDCCFSGAISKEFLRGGDVESQLAQMREAHGLHILTASTGLQTARERDSEAGGVVMGAFTRAIVEGIASGAADRQGRGEVTLADLRQHLGETLRGQTPKYLAHEASGEPLIARVPPRESPAQRRARRLGAWYAEGAIPEELYPALSAALESRGEDKLPSLLRRLLDNPAVSAAAVVAAWEGATRPPPRRPSPPPPPRVEPRPGELHADQPDLEPLRARSAAAEPSPAAPPVGAHDLGTRLVHLFKLDALPLVLPDMVDATLLATGAIGVVGLSFGLPGGQQDDFAVQSIAALVVILLVQKMIRIELGARARRRGAPLPDAFLRGPFSLIDVVVVAAVGGGGFALLPAMNYSVRRDTAVAAVAAMPLAFILQRWLRWPRGGRAAAAVPPPPPVGNASSPKLTMALRGPAILLGGGLASLVLLTILMGFGSPTFPLNLIVSLAVVGGLAWGVVQVVRHLLAAGRRSGR